MNDTPISKNIGIFAKISIKQRIFCGFFIILIILFAISFAGYNNLVTISSEIDELNEIVEEAALVAKIENNFLNLKSHAREYANLGHASDAFKVKSIAAILNPMIETAIEHLAHFPEMLEKMENIKHDLKIYIDDFYEVEILGHEFKSLIHDKLEPEGEKIVEDLDALITAANNNISIITNKTEIIKFASISRKHALKARLYANILIGRQDEKFDKKATDEFAKLKISLDMLGKEVDTKIEKKIYKEINKLFENYKITYKKIHKDELAIRMLVDSEMKKSGELIAQNAKWIENKSVNAEEKIRHEVNQNINSAEIQMLAASTIGLIIGFLMAIIIGNNISKPIKLMTDAMSKLASGDLSILIPGQNRGDEIGNMAAAMQIFKDTAIKTKEIEQQQAEKEIKVQEERKRIRFKMADDFEGSVGSIINSVASAAAQLQTSATTLGESSDKASEQSMNVAASAEQMSSNAQSVSAATDELSSSIIEITNQVNHSATVAKDATAKSEETHLTVKRLAESADRIGEVVKLITDIAEQTNLLALNATIEAARAGDAGKGFAVVANEVKNLAGQTARATDEISTQIEAIQLATKESVDAIAMIGDTVVSLNNISTSIAGAIEQQGSATQEISDNATRAAVDTNDVSRSIQHVQKAAEKTGEVAEEVKIASGELAIQSNNLKKQLNEFLNELRRD